MEAQIKSLLPPSFSWSDQIHFFESIPSTNDHAKYLAAQGAPHGTIVIADHQSGGRGRMGRSFYSPCGQGLYMSILLRPQCHANSLMHLTCAAAVAVCNGIFRATNLLPEIKWTNDIVWQKKKLGGILTELSVNSQTGRLDYAIIGIGINCNQAPMNFPEEIRSIAASLSMALGHNINREALCASVILALDGVLNILTSRKDDILGQYKARCITLGKDISLLQGDSVIHAHATDIDGDGGLIVTLPDGTVKTVTSGEVSVRGMYGYIP